jgi:hypothetical protein
MSTSVSDPAHPPLVGVDEAPVAVQADPVVTTGQANAGTVFKRLPVSCRWFCLEFAVLPEDSAVVDTFRWQIGGARQSLDSAA